MLSTCQRCNKQFNPETNTSNSCTFHRSTYVERESFHKSWDCCGKPYYSSRECGIGKHITYDSSYKKDNDFYATHRPLYTINIQTVRTCQRCNTQYNMHSNTLTSCKFHRCTFSGKIYNCCAGIGVLSPPCAQHKHITYDEKWIKWYDFFLKPIITSRTISGDSGSWIYHPQKGYIMVKWDANDEYKAIPANINGKYGTDNGTYVNSEIIDMDCIIEICKKYNNNKLSHAIYDVMKKLPFTKVTNHLIAQMMIIDLQKTNKLYGINLINDLNEIERKNTNQITENLISEFSSTTLDKLAEIM
eukprot:388718_1